MLLLQRYGVSPLEIKRASPLVASPTGIKWFWLAFWRVRNDFKHFKGWGAQGKLLSKRYSLSAPGELGCIRLLPWGRQTRAATTPRSHFWCWHLCLFSRGQWDTCTFPSPWSDFQVFCTSHGFVSTSPNTDATPISTAGQPGSCWDLFLFQDFKAQGQAEGKPCFWTEILWWWLCLRHAVFSLTPQCMQSSPAQWISLCSPPPGRRVRRWCLAQERAPVLKAAALSIQVKTGCTQESAWAPRPRWQHQWDRTPGVPWLWRDLQWGKLDPGSPQTPARGFLCGAVAAAAAAARVAKTLPLEQFLSLGARGVFLLPKEALPKRPVPHLCKKNVGKANDRRG